MTLRYVANLQSYMAEVYVLILIFDYIVQKVPLDELVYMADNLAYFPYVQQEEPLYIIHQIDILVSVSGSNLLQSFQEV